MTDLSQTIAPKSDQLNSDDLIAGPMTIKITKVSANPGSPEQPISLFFENDGGKPYKPCKSMRRVLVNTWGSDGNKFPGRAMTLYRDPSVKFGGFEVGGIRISHMTDIAKPVTMALTATRANRKPYTVQPLLAAGSEAPLEASPELIELAEAATRGGENVYRQFWEGITKAERNLLKDRHEGFKAAAKKADEPAEDDEPISAPAGEADNEVKGTSED